MITLRSSILESLNAGDSQSISNTLQKAIELEHSTIPLYLYSLYSLEKGKNDAIADIIQSIVVEEMLHMTLACNIINAIGGSPNLDSPSFVPSYPGPLPGGVEEQLTVHLAAFSMAQLEAFIEIEKPEDPIDFKALEALTAQDNITIGQFYQAISEKIKLLGDDKFVKPPRNQIGPEVMKGAVIVCDVNTAVRAIDTIVDQGEGTKNSPEEIVGNNFAHYYRFMEIMKGRLLVKQPGHLPIDQQFTYSGSPVPFDASGVYPVPIDPKAANYPVGSQQRRQCDTFNYTYTSLLKTLHSVVNGHPEQLRDAIGIMYSLKGQAKAMMSSIPGAGTNVGPSFEYQLVDSGTIGQ